MAEVPHVSVAIDDKEINRGACAVLEVIRPEWTVGDIEFKLLTDGITNKLVACKHKDVDVTQTVLVRIYGNKTDLLIDRKAETRNILLLSGLDLAPSLYATFNNGLAYQFVPGCTLTDETVRQVEIYTLVAVRMAKLHQVQVPGTLAPQPFIWKKVQTFLDLVPENFTDGDKNKTYRKVGPPKVELQAELDYLREKLSGAKNPIVFCHNDLLLDYEYAAYNYQAFDIANHFLEFAGVENVDYSKCPSKEFQCDWIRVYLREFQENFTEEQVEELREQVEKFTLVVHLFWGVWALIQSEHSYINFDFLGYGIMRFGEYFQKKKELEEAGALP